MFFLRLLSAILFSGSFLGLSRSVFLMVARSLGVLRNIYIPGRRFAMAGFSCGPIAGDRATGPVC